MVVGEKDEIATPREAEKGSMEVSEVGVSGAALVDVGRWFMEGREREAGKSVVDVGWCFIGARLRGVTGGGEGEVGRALSGSMTFWGVGATGRGVLNINSPQKLALCRPANVWQYKKRNRVKSRGCQM